MKFRVILVRQEAEVVVEAPSLEELEARLGEVYEQEDGSADWQDDWTWGTEEGTHTVLGEASADAQADYTLDAEEVGDEDE
jgi:hypothetical protein